MIEESNMNIQCDIKRYQELGDLAANDKELLKKRLADELETNDTQMKDKEV